MAPRSSHATIRSPAGYGHSTRIAHFSADGRGVTLVEADGTVRTCPLDLLGYARSRLPRALTAEERARYESTAK